MSDSRTFVIIGASLAGAKAAETLRDEGFDGTIVLIGDEPVRPYERPPLSKGFLQGTTAREEVFVHEEHYYASQQIDLRLSTTVVALDTVAKEATLDGGERLHYDSLLIATGSRPKHLGVPGAGLNGVHYLRTLADSVALHLAIENANRAIVVGGGWIGCEVAASARQLDAEVSMVSPGHLPLEKVLGREVAEFYRDLHVAHGVDLRIGAGIREFSGIKGVTEVHLEDGSVIEGDLVVVGVGITPRTELAEAAGIVVAGGIVTDEFLQTSAADVFAAGDVASAWHPTLSRRLRLDHWSAALNQGPTAAKNMLGAHVAYDKIPYFYSDQYDIGMEYSGLAIDWDEVVFRGDPRSGQFIAFWMKDQRVAAGMNVNVWDVADTIAALVAARRTVDRARLADQAVELASLTTD